MMKVREVIAILEKCNADAEVSFVYETNNPFDGTPVSSVIEIRDFDGACDCRTMVTLRG